MDKRKIMVVGPDFYNYNDIVAGCFEKKGYESIVVNAGTHKSNRVTRWIEKSFPKHNDNKVERCSKRFINAFDRHHPDYVLIIKGDKISLDAVKYVADKVPVALWVMDSIDNAKEAIPIAKHLKHCYVFEASDIPKYADQGFGLTFLPVGYDNTVYDNLNKEKDIDISFVGTMDPKRRKILESLSFDFPKLKMRFCGVYTSKFRLKSYQKFKNSRLGECFLNRDVNHVEANDLYNRSKICLNIHKDQSVDGWNVRLNEILGAGGFELVDSVPAIRREFSDGVAFYTDYEDLKKQIEFYINNPSERKKISERGYAMAKQNHTFDNRVDKILSDWRAE